MPIRFLNLGVVLAGALLLTPGIALAQQEVNPDHFDGEPPKVAQARPVAEHRKQAAAMHKRNADSKLAHKSHANKTAEPRKVAAATVR